MRSSMEMCYDGGAEGEEDFLAAIGESKTYMMDEQKEWTVPPNPAEVKRLAGSYRNAVLGDVVVHPGADEVVFQFGGWKSQMASKRNRDGTASFISIVPGVRGFEFNAPAAKATYTRLTLRDPQHTYEYEATPPAKKGSLRPYEAPALGVPRGFTSRGYGRRPRAQRRHCRRRIIASRTVASAFDPSRSRSGSQHRRGGHSA